MPILITWAAVTGMQPSLPMMRERLAEYGATTVLVALSQIAGIAKTWNNKIDYDADLKLIQDLLPTHRRTIERFRTLNHVLFTRISLLYVSRQACEVCSDDVVAPKLLEPHDFERIFETCLMANDLIALVHVLPNDTTIDKAAKLLPLANYVPHGTYPRDLARNLVILEEIAPLLKAAKNYRDIASLFAEATGVSPQAFCELAFCASVKYLGSERHSPERHSKESFILRPSNLAHDNVPKEDINAFFQKSSISIKDLLTLVRSGHVDPADFIVFQRYPLIQAGPEAYVCPDPGFLFDKLGKSLYWTLHEALPSSERLKLLAYWSILIERYAQWLFETTYRGRGQIFQSPRFSNGDEAADVIVVEGSCLIVIEVKACVLTTRAKYSFSPDTLAKELHLKAITGETGEPKGVAQLHKNLGRFLRGDQVPGIDLGTIKYLYPVLVFLDHGFTSPYLHDYYNDHFARDVLRGKPKKIIPPLFSVTITDLENVLPYTAANSLSAILDSYSRFNRDLKPEERQFRIPLLDGQKPGLDIPRQRFDKFGEDFHAGRFPDVPFPGHGPVKLRH